MSSSWLHQRSGDNPWHCSSAVAAYARTSTILGAGGALNASPTNTRVSSSSRNNITLWVVISWPRSKKWVATLSREEVLYCLGQALGVLLRHLYRPGERALSGKRQARRGWQGTRSFIIRRSVRRVNITSSSGPVDVATRAAFQTGSISQYQAGSSRPSSIRRSASTPLRCPQWPRLPHQRQARTQGQASNLLHDHLHIGDTVDIMPPAGDFFLQEVTDAQWC